MAGEKMKIAVAGVFHETNTFAPGMTEWQDFQWEWSEGEAAIRQRYEGTKTSMGGVIDASRELGVALIPGVYTGSMPSGLITKDTCEALMDSVIRSLPEACDGLVLILHGAMVADQYPDVEGELLRRVRDRVGPALPIATTLDLHANFSQQMVDLSDIIVGFDTYPHVDMYDRAVEATTLLVRQAEGRIHPTRSLKRPRMMVAPQTMMTTEPGPMKELVDRALKMQQDARVLNVTVAGGFPFSDVPDAGMAFLVTTNDDTALAEQYAEELSHYAWEQRDRFRFDAVPPDEAINLACDKEEGPVILAEGSDNVGGGSPADATHLLRHLVHTPRKSLIVIWDPEVVALAHEKGVGATVECEIGGKTDRQHGDPVQISGKVRLLFDGQFRQVGPHNTGKSVSMGKTAVVEARDLTLVLTEKRTPPFDVGHVRAAGVDPSQYHIIVVKSAVAWRTSFGDISKHVIHVDSPGCTSANLHHFDYRQVNRPIYPLDHS